MSIELNKRQVKVVNYNYSGSVITTLLLVVKIVHFVFIVSNNSE